MVTSQKLPTFWRQNFDGQKVGEYLQNNAKIDAGGVYLIICNCQIKKRHSMDSMNCVQLSKRRIYELHCTEIDKELKFSY